MILAAGEGRRMRPLTEYTPKPLLKVQEKTLIEYQLEKLVDAGFQEVVINVAYLADTIMRYLGDGQKRGIQIHYSVESEPLETAGALYKALPLLGEEPFVLLNGDVWHDYPLLKLIEKPLQSLSLGRLIFVPNPSHNMSGDFRLDTEGWVRKNEGWEGAGCTFSGLSLLSPELIRSYPYCREKFPLREVFNWAVDNNSIEGCLHEGVWIDIGTPERLEELRGQFAG